MTQPAQRTGGGTLTSQQQNIRTVEQMLLGKAMQAQLALALPKHVTPERLARIVLTQVRRIPRLAECSRKSFLGAVMECAQLGLEPGVLGQAWILPYKNVAQLIVGYRGLVALAWRSAQIAAIQAHEVYEGDHFRYRFGLAPLLEHEPRAEDRDPKRITHAYAMIRTTAGGELFDVLDRAQIDAVRRRSAAGESGPWTTDFAEMAKKTVLKRLLKLAPCSVEMQRAMAVDEAAETGEPQVFPTIDVTPEEPDPEPAPE